MTVCHCVLWLEEYRNISGKWALKDVFPPDSVDSARTAKRRKTKWGVQKLLVFNQKLTPAHPACRKGWVRCSDSGCVYGAVAVRAGKKQNKVIIFAYFYLSCSLELTCSSLCPGALPWRSKARADRNYKNNSRLPWRGRRKLGREVTYVWFTIMGPARSSYHSLS